jgi:hypothetical protein
MPCPPESVIASPTLFVFVGRGNPEKTKSIISLNVLFKEIKILFGFFSGLPRSEKHLARNDGLVLCHLVSPIGRLLSFTPNLSSMQFLIQPFGKVAVDAWHFG